jgi:hypothetical protein
MKRVIVSCLDVFFIRWSGTLCHLYVSSLRAGNYNEFCSDFLIIFRSPTYVVNERKLFE